MTPDPSAGHESSRAGQALERLPPGTERLARRRMALATERLAGSGATPDPRTTAPDAVADHLVRPLLLVDDWPDPTDPLPIGTGALHADLIDEDHENLARLRQGLDGPPDAETVAAAAQTWRLPVTPYRARRPTPPQPGSAAPPPPRCPTTRPWPKPLSACTVVDLSALWAGPLATSLLADHGARIIKVDPTCRPDALGEHPALYRQLNDGKEIVDLDLRNDGDRGRFETLVTEADLVVDSFSRRVMPNLGYGPDELRALQPSISTLSIVAFPAGTPEADWVAYGPGVHASSGLGTEHTADGVRHRAAPIAYPDALAGLEGFLVALELLGSAVVHRGDGVGCSTHREVSLAGAIAPLLDEPIPEASRQPGSTRR